MIGYSNELNIRFSHSATPPPVPHYKKKKKKKKKTIGTEICPILATWGDI